jgi:pyrroline-5-carboxylate reductase
MPEATLGVIGGGVMGEALISRLLEQSVFPRDAVLVSDPQPQRCQFLTDTYGVTTLSDNQVVFTQADVLLLAIKPQMLMVAADQLRQTVEQAANPPLLLSILAGTTLARLSTAFPGCPAVRAMPNTPATIGAGMTALSAGIAVTAEQMQLAKRFFRQSGTW